MAREMSKKARPFKLSNSDVIEENERILEAGSQQRKENREAEQAAKQEAEQEATASTSVSVAQEPAHTDTPTNRFALQGLSKKTTNGIVVNVPMEDYMQLTMMKCQTGRTLKDLALQAIHEFIERNK